MFVGFIIVVVAFVLLCFVMFVFVVCLFLWGGGVVVLGFPRSKFSSQLREREMFYLTTHSTHFIYGYMASDIWLRTILIMRKETRFRHIGYSYRLTAMVLLYAPSHRQDNTYHGLCYTSRGALAGTRNNSSQLSSKCHFLKICFLTPLPLTQLLVMSHTGSMAA